MPTLPPIASQAWDNRKGPVVLCTVSQDGDVNAIYVTCVNKYDEKRIVLADNYFEKTRRNILAGSRGSLLFIDKTQVSYQIKGTLDYCTSGDIFDDMKKNWLKPLFKGVAAVVMNVESVYRCSVDLQSPTGGAARLL
jgi:predicted pyridoxine 5'-phosphate oxidase superfamily flavin-nucleotide-binding protein